jgi:hypothetical protein
MSEKEKLIALYMETHSVTEFWFYPDVSEDQLRTLALDGICNIKHRKHDDYRKQGNSKSILRRISTTIPLGKKT